MMNKIIKQYDFHQRKKKKKFPIPLGCTLACISTVKHTQEYNSVKNVYPVPKFRWAL